MNPTLFKGSFSNPFDKKQPSEDPEDYFWTNQRVRRAIRIFSLIFVIMVIGLTFYRISQRPLTFEEKLILKEAVYLPIKEIPFRVTNPTITEVVESRPGEKERLYQTQLYSIGNIRYRAVTVYWNLSDIPDGITYKQVSPLGALKELMESDRYDGVVFMIGKEQEYYARSTFSELISKLKLQQSPTVRLKE